MIVLILALLLALVVSIEVGVRLFVAPSSRVQRRVDGEFAATLALRPGKQGGPRTLLLAGNSLLLRGVNVELLQARLAPKWLVQRFVIEDTGYLDWYFGLKRLFEDGAHPDMALIVMSPRNAAAGQTRGDYFARYLMRTSDLPAVVVSSQVHPTVGSGYLLARYSEFYALRAELRKQVLLWILPGLERMLSMLATRTGGGDGGAGSSVNKGRLLEKRAADLKEIERTHGVRVGLVFTPSGPSSSVSSDEALALAALQSVGLVGLLPLPSASTSPQLYSDGFHLNSDGSREMTERLARQLAELP